MTKKICVGYINFFDNELHMTTVQTDSTSPKEILSQGLIKLGVLSNEEVDIYFSDELDELEAIKESFFDGDMMVNFMEIE